MARIPAIVNELVEFEDTINEWLDVGTGDGVVTSALKWNNEASTKLWFDAVEEVPSSLDNSWKFHSCEWGLPESQDLITLFDVIEHFTKEDGISFIEECKKRSKHIVVFTPRGFFPQEGTEENPYMEHLSGWEPEEFEELGFETTILKGFHYHEGEGKKYDAIIAWR